MKAAWLNRILLILGLAGMFVAGFLSYTHAAGLSIPCGAESGCDKVAQHPTSQWLGFPVAYFGLGAYLALTLLSLGRAYADDRTFQKLAKLGMAISVVGLFASVYLTYTAIMVVKATCLWCLASAAIMLLTMIFHGILCTCETIKKSHGWLTDMALFGAGVLLVFGGIAYETSKLTGIGILKPVLEGKNATSEMLVTDPKYYRGATNPKITIVEYADFLCPACRSNFGPFKEFVDKYPDKIRVAFRHLPWFEKEEHAMSIPAAMISEIAADQGKFWSYVEATLTAPPEKVTSLEGLLEIAQKIGLNKDETLEAMKSQEKELIDRIFADYERAKKMGVQLTPTYIIIADGFPPKAATSSNIVTMLQNSPYKELLSVNGAQ